MYPPLALESPLGGRVPDKESFGAARVEAAGWPWGWRSLRGRCRLFGDPDKLNRKQSTRRLRAGSVVTRLDRLARSTRDLLNTLAAITGKGAGGRPGPTCPPRAASWRRIRA
jgi:hypothetical protein